MNSIICYASFRIVEEHFGYVSGTGLIIAVVLGIVALVLALSAQFWFPQLSQRLATHKNTQWLTSNQFGWILPFACALFLFPVCGLFSTSCYTFWLFLLFGWGFSAILLYFGALIDKWSSKQ